MRTRVLSVAALAALLAACDRSESPQPEAPSAVGAPAADAESLRAAPTPRFPDGRPDFNGTWAHAGGGVLGLDFVSPETLPDGSVCVFGCGSADEEQGEGAEEFAEPSEPFPAPDPTFPSYKPEHQARVDALRESQVETDTVLRCFPPGVPRIGPPGKIVQTSTEVVFLYNDYNGGFFRVVPLDGGGPSGPPTQLGHAAGRFEGDALVVETQGFTTDTWLTDNGAFHTADLRVVERLRRVGDTIDYEATAYDPAVLAEPWRARAQTLWRVAGEIEAPVPCEERDLPFMTDRSYHENPR